MKTFDNINDLNDFKASYPLASEYLWGRQTNYGLAMPECYMGEDMRGWLHLSSDCYNLSQDILHVANHRTWIRELTRLEQKYQVTDTWMLANFGSWATPYTAIIVKSDAPYLNEIEQTLQDLEDYPLLDEDLYSELEIEAADHIWNDCMSLQEKIDACKDYGISIFAARRDYVPSEIDPDWINPNHTI